eukprot:763601-Hanusia_phi.AAC.4
MEWRGSPTLMKQQCRVPSDSYGHPAIIAGCRPEAGLATRDGPGPGRPRPSPIRWRQTVRRPGPRAGLVLSFTCP